MIQIITPTPNIPCQPGWCLQYVRQAFGLPARYGSATEAWTKSASQHPDRACPPGLWVPVWFSIDTEPNGHVALLAPDGSVYSSSDLGSTPHLHPDIDELISYYAYWGKMQLTYLGWTEDVAGYPVVSADTITAQSGTVTPLEDPMPTPEELWDHELDLDGKLFRAGDILVYARKNAEGAKNNAETAALKSTAALAAAQAAPGLAVQSLLAARLPAPDGSGNSYTVAEYITFGWLYSMNAGPRTLRQTIKLADGTITPLADLLAAIYTKPAAAAGTLDIDALVARLKADLPADTVTALAAQLAK